MRDQNRDQNKGQQITETNKVNINLIISVITLNVNGLKAQIESQRFLQWIKKQDPIVCCYKKPTVNIKIPIDEK